MKTCVKKKGRMGFNKPNTVLVETADLTRMNQIVDALQVLSSEDYGEPDPDLQEVQKILQRIREKNHIKRSLYDTMD
jgi:hypothetical protein